MLVARRIVFLPVPRRTTAGGYTIPVGQATETDSAQSIAAHKSKALSQVIEIDLAQAISARKLKAIIQVDETDAAQSLTRLRVLAVGQAVETDSAQAISRLKRLLIGQVFETDLAQSIRTGAISVAIVQVTETDTALPITALVYADLIDRIQTIVVEFIDATTVRELLLATTVVDSGSAVQTIVTETPVTTRITMH